MRMHSHDDDMANVNDVVRDLVKMNIVRQYCYWLLSVRWRPYKVRCRRTKYALRIYKNKLLSN